MWFPFLAATALGAPHPLDCGVPARTWEPVQRTAYNLPPVPDGKATRNVYAGLTNVHETENFAIWWGDTSPATNAHLQVLGESFETAWTVQLNDMGFPAPEGSEEFRFNVYLGDTGGGGPSAEGAAGYYYVDTDGWPMIVIDKHLVTEPLSARLTAGHELHHAVQAPTGGIAYDALGAWYHEACANWILPHIFPGNEGYASTIYAVALRPEVSLTHFPDAWTGLPEDDHAYGAFLFPLALEESHGWELVRDSWVEAPAGADPLDVIDGLVDEMDLREIHLDYALRNATWDYADGQNLREWVDWYEGQMDSHRITGTVEGAQDEWLSPSQHAPHTLGVNQWALSDMPATFTIEFSGEVAARWDVGVVAMLDGTAQRWTQSASDGFAELVVDGWTEPDTAFLVVSAEAGSLDDGTEFSYDFRVYEGRPIEEEPTGIGCGCSSGGPLPSRAVWMLALTLFGLTSRRRESR
jgi:MYXO-CTERM domain-containing protein